MRKIFTIFFIFYALQMMAVSLVVEHRSGTDLLQDISVIGKWVYSDNSLQLFDKAGNLLASEPLENIKKIIFSSTDSAVENTQVNSIVVYPNPTQDVLMIQGNETQVLRVYDLRGCLLKIEAGTWIDVSDLAEGAYLLQIGTQVVRFIKQ